MLHSYRRKNRREAGCDEAGRGCLAGPVFAAAVILPEKFKHPLLDDSKKLKEKDRDLLRTVVEKEAISYGVAHIDNEEIDQINILNASFRAMHFAVEQLSEKPNFLLIDGNRFTPYPNIPHECIVQGEEKYASIVAASILAKTYRDEYMKHLHKEFPMYQWEKNKGYPTKVHRKAILEYGATPFHRKSFRLFPKQLRLF